MVATELTGTYDLVRPTSTQGEVYIYSPGMPGGSCTTLTYDLTADAMTGWGSAIALAHVPLSEWQSPSNFNDPTATASYVRVGGTGAWYTDGYDGSAQGFVAGFDLGQDCVVDTLTLTTDGGASQISRAIMLYLFNEAGSQTGYAFIGHNAGGVEVDAHTFTALARYVIIGMYAENPMTATDLEITFTASTAAQTAFSDDFAGTFAAPVTVGVSPGAFGGIDTSKIGTACLVGAFGQVKIANSGGSYSPYGDPMPTGAQPSVIFIPRYVPGTENTSNDDTNPDFVVMSNVLSEDDESMWIVTDEGTTFTDITPVRSGTPGLAVSANCLTMPWISGNIIIVIAEFGGSVRRLCVSVDGGDTWRFSGALDDTALAVTVRKGDLNRKQAFAANGDVLSISTQYQAATPLLNDKNIGLSDDLLFVEVYG